MMTTSAAGHALIEKYEGKRNRAYQDIVGKWTVGYGETGPDIGPDTYWTDDEVESHFIARLASEFEPGVNAAIGDAPTTQGQFDAMVSLAWNIGVGAFAGSTVCKRHVERNYESAADAFIMWTKAGGRVIPALVHRRMDEANMYYDASPDA